MGLLSDPEYGSVRWVKVLKKLHAPLCFLCYVAALLWFVMLGNREFNNETYFSENALLPGLVTNEFNGEYSAKQFYYEFLQELEDKYEDRDEMPVPWLVAKMSQLYLEVYTHNFTLNYPMGQGQVYKGTNVYGILRAPRTSSLEAIVVTAPFRPLSSHLKGMGAGIALMLAFAQFARPQKYWAKDIIFLITEHEQLGMQAWLEAYHGLQSDAETFYTSLGSFWKPGTPSFDLGKIIPGFAWYGDHQKCLDPGKLKGRSGSIQAAINLEFHTPQIKYVEVKVEGLNGQLPNLDLVNLVHKLCTKSGIHHSYKNSYSWLYSRNKMDQWTNNLWTMMGMLSSQLAGVPNGNHGLFHRFNIEAVTLEGRDANDPAGVPPRVNTLSNANFYRLGVVLESTLRSLNNLLERFHQSYFFYMLADMNRFISIGQYMPSLCLLCVAMLIRALCLWATIEQDEDDETNQQTDKKAPKKAEKDKKSADESETMEDDKKPGELKGQKVKDNITEEELNEQKEKDEKSEKEQSDQKIKDQQSEDELKDEKERDEKSDEELKDKKENDTKSEKELKNSKKKDKNSEVLKDQKEKDELSDEELKGEKNKGSDELQDQKKEDEEKVEEENSKDQTDLLEKDKESTEQTVRRRNKQADKKTEIKSSDSELPGDNKPKEKRKKRKAKKNQESTMSLVNIGTNYMFVHLLGYGVMNSPMVFSKIGAKYFNLPSEVSVFYGLTFTSVILMVFTPFLLRLRRSVSREELCLVNILVLIELSTLCLAVGVHNFSLGLVVATLFTPLALVAGVMTWTPGKSSMAWLVAKRALCLALHPLGVLVAAMVAYSAVLVPEERPLDTAARGRDAAMQAIMFAIVDSMIYGNWLFNVATSILLPIWLIFWQLLCNPVIA